MAQQAPQEQGWTFFFNFDASGTPQSEDANENVMEGPREPPVEGIEPFDQYVRADPEQPAHEDPLRGLETLDSILDFLVDAGDLDTMEGPDVGSGAFNSVMGHAVDIGALDNIAGPDLDPEPLNRTMGFGVDLSTIPLTPPVPMSSTGRADLPALFPAPQLMSGNPFFGFDGSQYQNVHAVPQGAAPMQYFGPAAVNFSLVPTGGVLRRSYQQHMPPTVAPRLQLGSPGQAPKQPAMAPSENLSRRGSDKLPVPIAPVQRASRHELTAKERKRMAKEANNAAKRVKRQH